MKIPWIVDYAAAQIDMHGWGSVPPHLAMAVQMIRNGGGCSSCRHVASLSA